MKLVCSLVMLAMGLMLGAAAHAEAADIVLARDGKALMPIVMAEDAPPTTQAAADTLAVYIEKITGSRPRIILGTPAKAITSAIWVGDHPLLGKAMPGLSRSFEHPEEILMTGRDGHIAILGRDRAVAGKQLEFGTPNAVYTFIEKYLEVRWFWPGELGEDVIERSTLSLPAFEYRFHPQIRQRRVYRGQYAAALNAQAADWYTFMHLQPLDSYRYKGNHAYTDWWEKYHQDHPEYFALLPNGKREPQRNPRDVKLCVSNPAVAQQWLEEAAQALKEDPTLTTINASPNDGPGFCVCDDCRAMDHPDGQPLWGYISLTDRYVKYWNTLARGLRERFPDRQVDVGVYAYSAYKLPPVAEKLEPNIALGYVGHFPLSGKEMHQQEQADFTAWSQAASRIIYRPNLFHYTGGWYGMLSVALRQTLDDMRFLADRHCQGISVDTYPQVWSTQGLQMYLMAKLIYDPHQDGQAILDDYYTRGFGPAADDVKAYYQVLQEAHDQVLEQIQHSSAKAKESVLITGRVFNEDVMKKAAAALDAAAVRVKDVPGKYADRVAFLRTGCDFVTLQSRIIALMNKVRESEGRDAQAVREAIALCEKRSRMFKDHYDDFALRNGQWYHEARKLDDYLGSPSPAFRKAAGLE